MSCKKRYHDVDILHSAFRLCYRASIKVHIANVFTKGMDTT